MMSPEEKLDSKRRAARKWRESNVARTRKYGLEYYSENSAKRCRYSLEYYAANRGRIAEQRRAWRKANPDMVTARNAARRAVKRRAAPRWADRSAVAAKYAEAKRLTRETGTIHHVDHIIPLKHRLVCGLHVDNNLQVLPAPDNIRKSNKFEVIAC